MHENNVKLKFAKQSYVLHITKLLTLLQPNKVLPYDLDNIDEKIHNNKQTFRDDVGDDDTVATGITSNPSSFSSIESMDELCKLSDESFDASKFELHSILGSGTFGTVFLAEYEHTYVSTRECSVTKSVSRQYAVKSVPKHKMQDSELDDLRNERQILSSMVDPFLLRFYGSCQTNDELYFVTEPVECGELFHAIYDGDDGLSHETRVFYSACILLGIDYIHSKKVVFRDLKPENIMIGKNGYPKIIDFGLAKQLPYTKLSEDNIIRKYTKCHTLCGTPEYISPEMLVKKEYDYAVDLWAFGVLIYEMIFMQTPFIDNKDNSDFTTMFSNILQSAKQGILISKKMDKKTDGTPNARNFVTQLLSGNENVRLGNAGSPRGLLQHPYFTIVSGRENELYAQTYTPPSFQPSFVGRDMDTRKEVKRYSGDQARFRDFDTFLVPKDKII